MGIIAKYDKNQLIDFIFNGKEEKYLTVYLDSSLEYLELKKEIWSKSREELERAFILLDKISDVFSRKRIKSFCVSAPNWGDALTLDHYLKDKENATYFLSSLVDYPIREQESKKILNPLKERITPEYLVAILKLKDRDHYSLKLIARKALFTFYPDYYISEPKLIETLVKNTHRQPRWLRVFIKNKEYNIWLELLCNKKYQPDIEEQEAKEIYSKTKKILVKMALIPQINDFKWLWDQSIKTKDKRLKSIFEEHLNNFKKSIDYFGGR